MFLGEGITADEPVRALVEGVGERRFCWRVTLAVLVNMESGGDWGSCPGGPLWVLGEVGG